MSCPTSSSSGEGGKVGGGPRGPAGTPLPRPRRRGKWGGASSGRPRCKGILGRLAGFGRGLGARCGECWSPSCSGCSAPSRTTRPSTPLASWSLSQGEGRDFHQPPSMEAPLTINIIILATLLFKDASYAVILVVLSFQLNPYCIRLPSSHLMYCIIWSFAATQTIVSRFFSSTFIARSVKSIFVQHCVLSTKWLDQRNNLIYSLKLVHSNLKIVQCKVQNYLVPPNICWKWEISKNVA